MNYSRYEEYRTKRRSTMTTLAGATIGQVHISVTDIDRAVAFYRDTLGLSFLFQVPGQPMAFFDCGGTRLYLAIPEQGFHSQPILYFTVSDIEDVHETLMAKGVSFRDAPHAVHRDETSELWMTFFSDPDGCTLALMEERAV
jgi:catechol 2,3-dioxygenase-like lactoylglutathione lyase family enzyme